MQLDPKTFSMQEIQVCSRGLARLVMCAQNVHRNARASSAVLQTYDGEVTGYKRNARSGIHKYFSSFLSLVGMPGMLISPSIVVPCPPTGEVQYPEKNCND